MIYEQIILLNVLLTMCGAIGVVLAWYYFAKTLSKDKEQ